MKNENLKALRSLLIELYFAANHIEFENRFDVASLNNNIHNVKVSGDLKYLDDFFASYQASKIETTLEYLLENKPNSIHIEHYKSKEDFISYVYELVKASYLDVPSRKQRSEKWINKHLKPVVAFDKVNLFTLFRKENRNKETISMVLMGNQERKGVIPALIIYTLLILFGFIFVYPIIYMITYSFMSTSDLVNPNVTYLPTGIEWQNYFDAWRVLNYPLVLGQTMMVSILPAICQTIVCALTGWGLARFKFKGNKIIFGLIIFTFLVPSCLTLLPTVSLYAKMKITGTVFAYVLPALFGQGLKSAVFILIFYQTFKSIPKVIIEAAEIDGANTIKIFLKIGIPAAKSAILLTVLLSVVWYYNETVLAAIFFGSSLTTLPLGIENFKASFDAIYSSGGESGKTINEAIYMAGTVLNILPLVVLYIFTQKFFIQGMDKAGITGE